MDPQFACEHVQRLGAYLSGLRPGCACVCCGTALEELDRRSVASRAAGTSPTLESAHGLAADSALVCPECGCEVAQASIHTVVARAA
jgi:hypothetical protein